MVKHVIILGSTGSIGTQALQVIADNPDKFHVVGIAAAAETPSSSSTKPKPCGSTPTTLLSPTLKRPKLSPPPSAVPSAPAPPPPLTW